MIWHAACEPTKRKRGPFVLVPVHQLRRQVVDVLFHPLAVVREFMARTFTLSGSSSTLVVKASDSLSLSGPLSSLQYGPAFLSSI